MSAAPRRNDRARGLFDLALEQDPRDRTQFVARQCAGDDALLQELLSLLRLHDEAQGSMRDPAYVHAEQPGERIGHYRLLQCIGEGGFGTVWMAEQEEPVRRKVALKVLKAGMDTAQVVARFEAERQALARMDHPNIAQVYDGGSTPQGRPYFVMELVRGVPITAYCDEANLSPRERLELFVPVCQAVQHAHHKGVIHRDIKPGNVLVTLHDGVPVPKVIDFGIAKATQGRLTDRTLFTEFRQMLGTPEYMAPEQAEMSGLDVDTRSDVYSLGVLLYELLTGTRPFDFKMLFQAGYAEMLRTIKEVEPARPSTRVSTLGERTLEVARHRRMHPRALGPLMRGDLDCIVMKSLEKERNRRYVTPIALAEDVQRYLRNDPVEASPPSRLYRLRKYVQRHRVGVAVAALIVLALAVGGGAAAWGLLRAKDEARLSRREAAKSEAIAGMLEEMLASSHPKRRLGPDYTVRQLLEDFDADLAEQFADQPEVELRMRRTMLASFGGLDLFDSAAKQAQRMRELRARVAGPEAEPTGEDLLLESRVLKFGGRYAEALASCDAAVALLHRPGSPADELAAALVERSALQTSLRDLAGARRSLEEALDLRRQLGDTDGEIHVRLDLASLDRTAGFAERSLQAFREWTPRARQLECFPYFELDYALGESLALHELNRFDEALAIAEESLRTCLREYGESNLETAEFVGLIGRSLARKGQIARGLEQLERAWLIANTLLGERHPITQGKLEDLAHIGRLQDPAAAVLRAQQLVDVDRQLGLEGSKDGAHHQTVLAGALRAAGRLEDALREQRKAVALFKAEFESGEPDVIWAEHELSMIEFELGLLTDPESVLRRQLDELIQAEGPDSARVLFARDALAGVLFKLGNQVGRAECLEQAVATWRRAGQASAFLAGTLHELGDARWALDRKGEARELFEDSVRMLAEHAGPESLELALTTECTAWTLFQANELDDAEEWMREALRIRSALGQPEDCARLHLRLAWLARQRRHADIEESELATAHELLRKSNAENTPLAALVRIDLARILFGEASTADEAEQLCRQAVAIEVEPDGAAGKLQLEHVPLINFLDERGALDVAEELRRRVLLDLRSRSDASIQTFLLPVQLAQLGENLLKQGRPAEAEPVLRECLEIRIATAPDSWLRHNAQSLLGAALLAQSRFDEAEELLVEAAEEIQPAAGYRFRRRDAIERVIRLFESTERSESASVWRERLAELAGER